MKTEAQKLTEQIEKHTIAYYAGDETISDFEFDEFVARLKALVPDAPILSRVGAPNVFGDDVVHSTRMGSLAKTKTIDEVMAWASAHPVPRYGISQKIDGLAVTLTYINGRLQQAATRGDGEVGKNITQNALQIKDIPHMIPALHTIEIRGEVYMRKSVFAKVNAARMKAGEIPFKNPRNAAAGSLLNKDPNVTADRELSFFGYGDPRNAQYVPFVPTKVAGINELNLHLDAAEYDRNGLDYPIDGMVIDIGYDRVQALGMTSGCPNGMIAYKFSPEKTSAIIKSITYQTGRTGKVTPVAELEPILLDGSMIKRATLHNCAHVLELGMSWDAIVELAKGGDIIPQVLSVLKNDPVRGSIPLPATCPSCGGALTWNDSKIDLMCTYFACPAQAIAFLYYWITLMDIDEVGPKAVVKLHEHAGVNSPSDLYNLTPADFNRVFGPGKRSETIQYNLNTSKTIPLWKFLAGLGIPELGRGTGKLLAKEFKNLEDLNEFVYNASSPRCFEHIDGIGETTSAYIYEGLLESEDLQMDLLQHLTVEDHEDAKGGLTGISFCITGAMPSGRKRPMVEELIRSCGGEVRGVSKGLNYLVQADPSSTSGKTKKALALGVKIISEDELDAAMNNGVLPK